MRETTDLLDTIAGADAVATKLARLQAGETNVVFEHVFSAAQPILVSLIARSTENRIWVVCENVRVQELLHDELLNWLPSALLFPEIEMLASENVMPDAEVAADRLGILQNLTREKGGCIVVTRKSVNAPLPSPAQLEADSLRIARWSRADPREIAERLGAAGFERVPQVSIRGQFAVRGGILDVFSWDRPAPLRIEFSDDQIESIREFDLDSQTAVRHVNECRLLLGDAEHPAGKLTDYISPNDLIVDVETGLDEMQQAHAIILEGSAETSAVENYDGAFFEHGLGEFDAGDLIVHESRRAQFFRQLEKWREENWNVFVFCNNEGEAERLGDLIPAAELDALSLRIGTITRGFAFPDGKVVVLSDAELFGRYRHTRARRLSMRRAREQQARRAQIDFTDLAEGDYVVHLEHGIGRYLGLQNFATESGAMTEVLAIEFADEAKLYVPLEQSFLISKYIGVGKKNPALSNLGDARWSRAKKSAEQAVVDYASKLLAMHAERETSKGFNFAPDNKWQREFENSFLYKETPDQLTAIIATKADMESEQPMDRLICGDVGFGKTEVAIRAAFKAVMNGKQVAVLVPTTVLAQQHYQNFRERMSDYPVTVEVLSRFRSAAEQRKVVKNLREGGVDIVIGTHRLISKDVEFKNLGLVVVDEEQRFGVLHKEKFKALFKLVDVLTLSATPIPRTLYLSLMGAKDMSIIETAPPNRIPIETVICAYDERVVRDAINRELGRQGQVYFLHNRVQSIHRFRERIELLCPDARVAIGHGQMGENELEAVMQRFVSGEIDVLVSTTIIESGLDIPNANTIIIDRADRFGLADLYQLRGRVGRAQHKAYAYLMLSREMMAIGSARKRINAIKQYSSLGAGFKIAMRDLEIRGAGNILGTAQSGHIVAIGFDLYCQLLKQAIARLKGESVRPRIDVSLRLDFIADREGNPLGDDAPAFIPAAYMAEAHSRIQAYRQVSEISSQEQLDQLRKTWRDRFGRIPLAAENLLLLSEIKIVASSKKLTMVEVRDSKLMLTRGGDYVLIAGKFPRLQALTAQQQLHELLDLLRRL
ncbi:MAG: transcription-repair coupling factor [Verrucomicrobiota bacterium]|nr:transcription-repair coupling factor [Verrucomicrobiota bacterium]